MQTREKLEPPLKDGYGSGSGNPIPAENSGRLRLFQPEIFLPDNEVMSSEKGSPGAYQKIQVLHIHG